MTRALGSCVIAGAGACGAATSVPTDACLLATVTNVPKRDGTGSLASWTASLKVSNADVGVTYRGTLVLLSGGGSTGLYEQLLAAVATPGATPNVILPAIAAGWKVIQVAWTVGGAYGCMTGASEDDGSLALAGRTATLLRAIYDEPTLYTPGTIFAYCGQSGGSSQIAYALAHYGAGSYVDCAILSSGPPHARIDFGGMGSRLPQWVTIGTPLLNVAWGVLDFQGSDATYLDYSLGPTCTRWTNHCVLGGPGNYSFVDSIMNGTAEYRYPQTDMTFFHGQGDSSAASSLGKLYANAVSAKSHSGLLYTTNHEEHVYAPGSTSGAAIILNALANARFNH